MGVSQDTVEEPLLNEMLEDLDLLKQRLAECDADQRNRPNSIGLREKQMEAIQSVLETNGNITLVLCLPGRGRRELLRALLGLYGKQQGPMLMISLISLMDDQRAQWHSFSDDLQIPIWLHSDLGFEAIASRPLRKHQPFL